MTESERSALRKLGPPGVEAARIRSSYKWFFSAPAFCLAVAVADAVGRHWLYAASFAASALMYFPVALAQYRSSRDLCEKAITEYQGWTRAKKDVGEG